MFNQTKSESGKETVMKQQKLFVIVITVCALLLSLAGCASSSAFDGSSAKNADSYHLDVKIMNGTDTHTLELKQGDTLKILFETVKGSLEMKITSPDGTSLYQGDGTVTEFTVEAPVDGPYAIVVVGQKAKGSIHIDVERVPEAVEPEGTQEPEPEPEAVTLTSDDLVGPWHLADDEKDNATAIEAIPGAIEFGSSMEITSDGHISWYIGADGGTGTYSLSGDILSADMTNDFDQSSMKMEFTAEKTEGGTFLYTEYKGLLLCWSQGEGETGKGGDDEAEVSYPGADVVELVSLRGDTTTVYKLADGTYMDRIECRFTYNGTDTWTDEDGVEWNEVVKSSTNDNSSTNMDEVSEDEAWKEDLEKSLFENYGLIPKYYEDLGDGIYQVYMEVGGEVVLLVKVDSETGDYQVIG